MEVEVDVKQECYHCGEPCERDEVILHDDKSFCCSGCSSVYQILKDADLCDFYNLEERTGKVLNANTQKYLVLDSPEVAKEFIEFSHEGLAKTTFFAPSIHCSSCIWLLEHLNRIQQGVVQSKVNFLKKEISITYRSDEVTLKDLAFLLDSIGYSPQLEKRSPKKTERSLMIRLAVAGFCFGNSMLITIPEYLDLNYQIPRSFSQYFGYINLLFALPVFFYSAIVYFQSAWKGLKHKYINIDVPISLGIITLFVRSLFEILAAGGTGFVDSLTGLVFFLLIGRWYQHKTYQALSFDRGVGSYFPIAVTKVENDHEITTRLEDLKVGDDILIRNTELIPADCELVEGDGNIDYSFVTGESIPASVEQGSQIFAGGRQIGGSIVVRLIKSVHNSHMTKLWNSDAQADSESGINNISDKISQYFTLIIILIALGAGIAWWWIDSSKAVDVFTAILIVACPCALALAVPFSYGHTLRVFGNRGFFLKNANVVEKIARVKSIIFDKTGTLTNSLPENVSFIGEKELSESDKSLVYSVVSNSIHPLSKIISNQLKGAKKQEIFDFQEAAGLGIQAECGGRILKIGSAKWVGLDKNTQNTTNVFVSISGEIKGYFEFKNSYRDGIIESLKKLQRKYSLHLLSGDNSQEKEFLSPYFEKLNFKQSPEDKLEYTQSLKRESKVMMVGDGLNDAGALKESDVGISISDDVYQFSPSCDAILDSKKISRFPIFMEFSRISVKIVYLAFVISFMYNLVGLGFAITGQLTPLVSSILMPISSVSVVGIITLMINLNTPKLDN